MSNLWVTADELDDPTLVDSVEAARVASSILYMLSGRKYPGENRITEVYECENTAPCGGLSASRAGRRASTRGQNMLKLRGNPVKRIIDLRVGADRRFIPPSEYRLLDRKWLEPTPGATWGPCSGVEVTYEYGMNPPLAGRRAARALANQIVKSRVDPDNCTLPDRVTSVSRQGVSFTVLDPQDFLADGRTGLYEVDLFLKASNPNKAQAKARVFLPDTPRGFTVTTVKRDRTAGAYDLNFERGVTLHRTFRWTTGGIPQVITGEWIPQAFIRTFAGHVSLDLTPYITVEPDEELGRIDLDVPATLTAQMGDVQGTWALVLRRTGDDGQVVKLLEGDVWIEDL